MATDTTQRVKDTLNEQTPEVPASVRNPRGAGRKPHSVVEAGVQQRLDTTAPKAVEILSKHIERRRGFRKLPSDLQRACEYVIDHAIGKARQKIEHSGSVMTYGDLAKSAEQLEKQKPRLLIEVETPIEAEVKELSNTIVVPEPPKE